MREGWEAGPVLYSLQPAVSQQTAGKAGDRARKSGLLLHVFGCIYAFFTNHTQAATRGLGLRCTRATRGSAHLLGGLCTHLLVGVKGLVGNWCPDESEEDRKHQSDFGQIGVQGQGCLDRGQHQGR